MHMHVNYFMHHRPMHSDSRTRYTEVAGSPPARAAAPHVHTSPDTTHAPTTPTTMLPMPTTPDLLNAQRSAGTAAPFVNIFFTPNAKALHIL